LEEWTKRLRDEAGNDFPDKVTAFRDNLAVHGRYKKPCPNAELRFNGFAMPPTRPTTAHCVKPEGTFWPIGPCHDF
jgi:hypothetical protein